MFKFKKLETIQIDPRYHLSEIKKRIKHQYLIVSVGSILLVLLAIFILITSGPSLPPKGVKINIEKGTALPAVTTNLSEKKVIRSKAVFNFLMRVSLTDKHIKPGIYLFSHRINAVFVVWRLRHGNFGVSLAKVTIPEGATNKEIGLIIKKSLPEFDRIAFGKQTTYLEGKLFPETYYLSPLATTEQIIDQLNSIYEDKIRPLRTVIAGSGKTENEIITMASLLEEEAKNYEAKKIISGILWKRLEQEMRLQVDAVFPYIMGKNTFELTKKDLTIDSPYNTYKYKGLPPGPISNPGIDSILAALYPQETPYLYYLSDKNGKMHYAETYEEHLKNKRKYLGT